MLVLCGNNYFNYLNNKTVLIFVFVVGDSSCRLQKQSAAISFVWLDRFE